MSAALHLAKPADLDRLMLLVQAFHLEEGIQSTEFHIKKALEPLLEGSPHGAVYLIGPSRSPIGYIVVTFGWSIELGGLDGFIDEIYIRSGVRGRGVGTEVISALVAMLKSVGMMALHLEVEPQNERALRLYKRCHFKLRDGYHLMSRML
ncbi:GNAT family N-acetyltransferase [Planktotalea sp.]|uniref:GNAT family N-acetyltransferase n=1 Tax=Planktotalea sp. TaxID=2029877 RepID=UPI003D6BBD6C